MRLEDLKPEVTVRGVLPDVTVIVVSVQWFGTDALELTYKDPRGRVGQLLLYREDEPRLEVMEHGRPWSFDGDGATSVSTTRTWTGNSAGQARREHTSFELDVVPLHIHERISTRAILDALQRAQPIQPELFGETPLLADSRSSSTGMRWAGPTASSWATRSW